MRPPAAQLPPRPVRALALLGWAALLAAGALPGARAQGDEQARLAAERAAVEARYAEARAACLSGFLVNDCLDAAQLIRRQALDTLHRQQLQLDDARRRQRTAEHLRQQQLRTEAAKASAPPPQPPPLRREGAAAATAPAPLAVPRPVPASAPASGPDAAARERRHEMEYRERQQAAEAHRQAVEARNAAQDSRRAPAAGLPMPAASAGP